jgi:exopolysaccharide production protein ExoZ
MINALQAGRFFAAFAVVLHHAVISVTALVDVPPQVVQVVLDYGYLGVDFFFVLSGFIIHYAMHITPRPAGQFALERLKRIFLPYWPIGVALGLAYTLMPTLSDSEREWGWLPTLTLFPTSLPPALSVAWTLQHELVFYMIYAALFFALGKVAFGMMVWAIAIIVGGVVGLPDISLLKVVLAPINVEFVAGVAAAGIFLSGRAVPFAGAVAVSSLLILAFVLMGAQRSESWLIGFAIAALIPSICQAERAGAFSVPGWLVFGGAASYAIYLIHNPLLSLTSRLFAMIGLGWVGALIASAVICVIAGAVYYVMWERPVMRLAKKRAAQAVPNTG